jgi:YD repeat-containing protein
MSYDADGNLTSVGNADHQTTTYTYDPLSRLTSEHAGPSVHSPTIATWVYDKANHAVRRMSDPIGQLSTATAFDSHGHAYVIQQTGFNAFAESTGQTITIPRTPSTGTLAGTYTQHQACSKLSGLPTMTTYPASPRGGSLPAENVAYSYCTRSPALIGKSATSLSCDPARPRRRGPAPLLTAGG